MIIPFVSSGEIILTVHTDKTSFDLFHGESDSTVFIISNKNTICDLSCSYRLIKNDNEIIESNSFISVGQNDPKSLTGTFRAPTKDEVRNTGGKE